MDNQPEPPPETDVEAAVRRVRIDVSWRQWALERALLSNHSHEPLKDVMAQADTILAWMFQKL
jgi:hypothetical protein